MEKDDKSKQPEKETISERLRRIKREAEESINQFDKNGNLVIHLRNNDSALVVREDGTIEMVSHELENHEDGFLGDVEDLNKTFSLVLALASALENEELYNRIFHNLHMSLMSKWNHLSEDVKAEIIERRKNAQNNRTEEERIDKQKRIDDFRSRMNKYKEQFLDDIEAEKRRLQKDLEDEAEFHRKYGGQFSEEDEADSNDSETIDYYKKLNEDEEHFAAPDDIFGQMESRPKKKINKKKRIRLPNKNTNWNPYDETLKANFKDYRADAPPEDEDE